MATAGAQSRPKRPWRRWPALVVVCAAGILAGYVVANRRDDPRPPIGRATEGAPRANEVAGARGTSSAPGDHRSARPMGTPSIREATVAVRKAKRRPTAAQRSPSAHDARELLEGLTRFVVDGETLTDADAEYVDETLRALAAQGQVAVPAIRSFLRRRQDVRFDVPEGADGLAAYGSLRLALLDVLGQIGGDGALEASLEQLRATKDPVEIAMLALNLEEARPETYREEILAATRRALTHEARLPPEERVDVSPLFELFQAYGGPDAVLDIEEGLPGWWQYSLMALAALPDGQGVPALVSEATMPGIPVENRAPLPFQMLAQASIDSPQAADALTRMARAGEIPERAWSSVGSALKGMHIELPLQLSDGAVADGGGSAAADLPVLGEYTSDGMRYELRLASAGWSGEQIHAQLELIDALLAATSSPGGKSALREARDSLEGTLTR